MRAKCHVGTSTKTDSPFRFIAQGLDVRLAGMVSKAVVKMCRCKISHLLDDTLIQLRFRLKPTRDTGCQ